MVAQVAAVPAVRALKSDGSLWLQMLPGLARPKVQFVFTQCEMPVPICIMHVFFEWFCTRNQKMSILS